MRLDWFDCKDHSRHWVSQSNLQPPTRSPLTTHRINCRLPQTPRSPFVAASHYFDDIFSRSGRPSFSRRPSIRRSSTTRSIGNRSDYNSTIAGDSTPAVASTVLDDEETSRTPSRRGSTTNPENEEHISNYVESQLQRVRSSASIATSYEDELETRADKENGSGQNGHA